MKAKKIGSTKTMTKEEWLDIRRRGITGSRIAGVMNISPWETPRSVYLDLIGQRPEKQQTEPMYFGNVLENIIANEYGIRTESKIRRVNFVLQHSTFDFLLGNIDRLIIEGKNKGVLEVKNVSAYSAEEWKTAPPDHYIAQLQFYLALTGYKFGVLAALIGGQKFVYHRIERDDEYIENMIQQATEFWYNFVEARQEPPITDRDTELLNGIYSTSEPDKSVNISCEDFPTIVEDTIRARDDLDRAEREMNLRVNQIKDIMRDADSLTVDGMRLATWRENKNGRRTFRLSI